MAGEEMGAVRTSHVARFNPVCISITQIIFPFTSTYVSFA